MPIEIRSEQVLINLVKNAIDATLASRGKVRYRLERC